VTEPTIRVAMVCTGNICRSPMAEIVLQHLVKNDEFLRDRVDVTSAGTANWHVGGQMDPRARQALDRAELHSAGTAAAYAGRDYLDGHDLIVVMTSEHLHDVQSRLTNEATEVIMLRNLLSPGLNLDVADPYYGDAAAFDECLNLLTEGGRRLTSELRRRLGADSCEV
jgi:protein-tyrosine phosphatase